jgi:zinc transport system substrate-binding protein
MRLPVAIVTALLAAYGCSSSGSDDRSDSARDDGRGKPVIMVVNYPLEYFAERIGGDGVDVRFPVPSGVDPAFWNPEAETVSAFQNADLILLNGAAYAKWTFKVSLPSSKMVDTSKGFGDRYIEVADAVTHTHGPGGDHAHGGTAFTTWLDLAQAAEQAGAIRDALTDRWPAQRDRWERGYEALEGELLAVDTDLRNTIAGKQSLPLIASHPVYQYLARRYALNLKSVMWEPDEFPSESQWRQLSQLANEHGAGWMLWEADPLPATKDRLEEMGIRSVVFEPCGNAPEEGDFMTVMRQNVEGLKSVFR